VKHWAYLSIGFFIVLATAQVVNMIFLLIPFLGKLLAALVDLSLLIIYVIGLLKSLEKSYWRPPVVYELAKAIGL